MTSKEKIKNKIRALLEKNIDNGATEEEMILAMQKAEELMIRYEIIKSDLKIEDEKCILNKTPKFESGFRFVSFLTDLAKLFNCEYYYTKKEVFFFGYEQDTELCIYFYLFIVKNCLRHKNKFLESSQYEYLKSQGYHGRTLSSDFIKGFLYSVSTKLADMYFQRNKSRGSSTTELMIRKEEEVKEQFNLMGLDIKEDKTSTNLNCIDAVNSGSREGDKLEFVLGVNKNEKRNNLYLN